MQILIRFLTQMRQIWLSFVEGREEIEYYN